MRTRSLIPLFSASTVLLLLMSVGVSADDTTLTDNEQLGKSLFFDENLSVNSNQSCATCHDPAAGWVGPDSMINAHGSVYEGSVAGMFGDRKPPSAAYATQSPVLHVDKKGLLWAATSGMAGPPGRSSATPPPTRRRVRS
jgi:Cytochrome c peroxidase